MTAPENKGQARRREARARATDTPKLFTRPVTLRSGRKTFQEELPGYFVDYVAGGRSLVITFESANGAQERPDGFRDGWGQDFLLGEGLSILAVKPKKVDWYRGADLHDLFCSEAFRDFARQFETTMFYGSSMGGFAALAFSHAIPGSIVLAHVPQSTLDPDLVPWERRFIEGRRQDWSGKFRDAAVSVPLARRIYVTYDPFYAPDAQHVARIASPNLVTLKLPFARHGAPNVLKQLGVLKEVFRRALAAEDGFFPPLARGRRTLPSYYLAMHRRARNAEVARFCLERAMTLDPQDRTPMFLRFRKSFHRRRYSEALEIFRSFGDTGKLKNQMKLVLLSAAARSMIETGDRAGARALARKLAGQHTEDLRFYRVVIDVCEELGEHDLTVAFRNRLAALAP